MEEGQEKEDSVPLTVTHDTLFLRCEKVTDVSSNRIFQFRFSYSLAAPIKLTVNLRFRHTSIILLLLRLCFATDFEALRLRFEPRGRPLTLHRKPSRTMSRSSQGASRYDEIAENGILFAPSAAFDKSLFMRFASQFDNGMI